MSTNSRRLTFFALGLAVLGVAFASPGNPRKTRSTQKAHRKTTDPPVPATGKLGQDLFLAVDHRDVATVQALLTRGADPNARNGLEFTPLYMAAASYQPDVVKALLEGHADPAAESPYGAPITFAAATGNTEAVRALEAKGVDVNVPRVDGISPLMMAANAGNPECVAELLANKAKVNARNLHNASALMYAARAGHVEVGRMLIKAGAKVDTADVDKRTPLMAAAMNGRSDFVKLLLENGAKVNARDASGRTALLLAASYGDSPDVVRALVAAGANRQAVDVKGRTAAVLASTRGYEGTATLLGAKVDPTMRSPRTAVVRGLRLLEKSMTAFNEGAACISCHQEGLGRMTTGEARMRGFPANSALAKVQTERIRGALGALRPLHEQALKSPEAMKQVPLIEINEVNPSSCWLLAGMAAQGDAPTQATAAAAMVLARQQTPEGCWTFSLPRIPMQSSVHAFTALAVRSLRTYGPKARSAEIADRIAKAKAFLLKAPTKTSDDLAFRLLGLKWAGTAAEERKQAMMELAGAQNADGGWSQMPGMPSDAYATGQALYALTTAGGLATSEPAYNKGAGFLLRTQDDDGSWFVNKRAIPANNYFDAKFPHGESQYASFNATCWATMALLESMGKRQ